MSEAHGGRSVGGRPTILDWVLRLAAAMVFMVAGAEKFGSRGPWIRIFREIGFGQWFRYFTGAAEVVGAILLMIPRATFAAAGLLACTMAGALLVQMFLIGVGPESAVVLVLLALVSTIALRHR